MIPARAWVGFLLTQSGDKYYRHAGFPNILLVSTIFPASHTEWRTLKLSTAYFWVHSLFSHSSIPFFFLSLSLALLVLVTGMVGMVGADALLIPF